MLLLTCAALHRADLCCVVLCCAAGADALSRYIDWRDRGTCILFGDGCGAVVLRAREGSCGLLGIDMHSGGCGSGLGGCSGLAGGELREGWEVLGCRLAWPALIIPLHPLPPFPTCCCRTCCAQMATACAT